MTEPNPGRLPGVEVCLNCGAGVAASAYCGACGQLSHARGIRQAGMLPSAAT